MILLYTIESIKTRIVSNTYIIFWNRILNIKEIIGCFFPQLDLIINLFTIYNNIFHLYYIYYIYMTLVFYLYYFSILIIFTNTHNKLSKKLFLKMKIISYQIIKIISYKYQDFFYYFNIVFYISYIFWYLNKILLGWHDKYFRHSILEKRKDIIKLSNLKVILKKWNYI